MKCHGCENEAAKYNVPTKVHPNLRPRYAAVAQVVTQEREAARAQNRFFDEPDYRWQFCSSECRRAWIDQVIEWTLTPIRPSA